MGALKIDCYCSEVEMNKILKHVIDHIDRCLDGEVADIDEVIGDIRLCVDFDCYMDELRVKASEILDSDWDQLYEDTAVLTSRLKPVIESINRNNKESIAQCWQIRNDQSYSFQL